MQLKIYLDERRSTPISYSQIEKLAPTSKFVDLDTMRGKITTARLFDRTNATAILATVHGPQQEKIRHWICLLRVGQNKFWWFDSLGHRILQLLEKMHIKDSGFGMWAKQNLKSIVQFPAKLQKDIAHVNTCGCWVASRIVLRKMGPKKFAKFWQGHKSSPDTLVTQSCWLPLFGTD